MPLEPEPEYVGHGVAGCVFHPAIRCGSKGQKNTSSISKVFNVSKMKNAQNEFEDSKRINKLVDPQGKFTIATREICFMNTRQHIRQVQFKYCQNLSDDTVTRLENRPLLPQIVYEDGGRNLTDPMVYKRISLKVFMEKFRVIFEALPVLQAHHIVHMDIKPGNIVFNMKTGKLALIDFGLAYTKWCTLYEKEGINDRMFQFEAQYEFLPPEMNLIASIANQKDSYCNLNYEAIVKRADYILKRYLSNKEPLLLHTLQTFLKRWDEEYILYKKEMVNVAAENMQTMGYRRALGTLLRQLSPYIEKVDVYGVGITLFEILLYYISYSKLTSANNSIVADILNIIFQMVQPNPRLRATPMQSLAAYSNAFPDQRGTLMMNASDATEMSISPKKPSPKKKPSSPTLAFHSGGGNKKTRVIKIYANWCSHCIKMRSAWHSTKALLSKDPNITITEIESEHLPVFERNNPEMMRKIRDSVGGKITFPTIVVITPKGCVLHFKGERTPSVMSRFIKKAGHS